VTVVGEVIAGLVWLPKTPVLGLFSEILSSFPPNPLNN